MVFSRAVAARARSPDAKALPGSSIIGSTTIQHSVFNAQSGLPTPKKVEFSRWRMRGPGRAPKRYTSTQDASRPGPDLRRLRRKLMDKASYLASVRRNAATERIVSESMNVHLYGAVAVVNGVYRENGAKNGKPYTLRERFTDTWSVSRIVGSAWLALDIDQRIKLSRDSLISRRISTCRAILSS